jgi:hypothetical protein
MTSTAPTPTCRTSGTEIPWYLAFVKEVTIYWTERFCQLLSGHGLKTGPLPFL